MKETFIHNLSMSLINRRTLHLISFTCSLIRQWSYWISRYIHWCCETRI